MRIQAKNPQPSGYRHPRRGAALLRSMSARFLDLVGFCLSLLCVLCVPSSENSALIFLFCLTSRPPPSPHRNPKPPIPLLPTHLPMPSRRNHQILFPLNPIRHRRSLSARG